jgi:hypothetical protein
MFYRLFRRYLHRYFQEIFGRHVIVAGSLTIAPLSSRSTND